jgi:uncharacterized protein (TIGR03083 family)
MNDTDDIALVDTTRDELVERLRRAWERFDRLARTADPRARVPGHDWTVHQTIAHVLGIMHRYEQLAHGLMYRPGANPREIDILNQIELEEAMAPVPDLADQIGALVPEINDYFAMIPDGGRKVPFHAFAVMSDFTAQTNLIGELVLHGEDIARAVKVPWEIDERDMLLIARGLKELAPPYVRSQAVADVDACVAFNVPQARPFIFRIDHGHSEMRARRPEDRPDAVLRLPASTLVQLLYQRIGPLAALRRGLRIVGGRRPWVALKLMSYLERP